MNKFLSYTLIVLTLWTFSSCGANSISPKGSLIGRVYNEDKSRNVANAEVAIDDLNLISYTDEDGWYSITDIPLGRYTITVTNSEYARHRSEVSIESEGSTLHDVVLYSALSVRDASGSSISVLDFGETESSLSILVLNNGEEAIQCRVETDCSWAYVVASNFTIPAGDSKEIIVSIERSKLEGGHNSGNLSVISGSMKKTISIKAFEEIIKPKVQTLPMSSYYGSGGGWVDTFNGRVLNEGKPPYKQKGFCFSPSNREPTVSDIIVGVSGNNGAKDFSFYALEYFANHPYRETYFARAWIMYGENQYEYGDAIEFVFNPSNLSF